MAIAPGTRLGPYEVNAPLGKGGMGEVYRAHDTRLDRTVAVKVLPADSVRNTDRVQRFEKEAKAASARNHPNILTIYDFGVTDSTYYIAMEFVEGHTLHHLIHEGEIPLARALAIAVQCASGLAAAHSAGIVHRDIKPDNIMVRPDGYVKILDFGLAKLAEKPPNEIDRDALTVSAGLTAPGMIMGTFQYMSPEQARGQDLDARTDTWSLGAVLYEMVTGKSPFADKTMSDTLASILNREPPALSSYGVAAPDELKHILAKALAKHRDERYQSIKDMELDLIQLRKDLESGVARISQKETASRETKASQAESNKQSTGMSRGQRRSLFLTVGVLSAALLTWAVMANRSPVATPPPANAPPPTPVTLAPDRQLSYSLLVQKARTAKPYRDAGHAVLENGSKVKFEFSVPQSGSLYLLNDGPGPDGKQELNLEFPTPSANSGSAQVMAFKSVQTGWLVMDKHAGREKFWIVWSTRPLPELEQAIQQASKSKDSAIPDQESQAIRTLLATATRARVDVDHDNKLTSLNGHGDVLVSELELEHR